ncbi:hypothetical protein CKR_1492 [Clostridium kluyveri NBRC 12016]|uniref:Na+/H+ antiporter NhaC-like C-terminal domain-containing protein n=1 Tax=Clostridium kluyveri (strain NBRC 12016) TaxID=583346 RepID=B9E218_CLOK1|nr:hypothetical protein CKR_1492 [Clostridium kluyveri NBRC 12016]
MRLSLFRCALIQEEGFRVKNDNISIWHRTFILTFTLIPIIMCIVFNVLLFYGLFISVVFSLCMFKVCGFTFKELLIMIINSFIECRELFILIVLIGITIPIWFSSGIIPAMMFYGFDYIIGKNLIFVAFIFTSLVSISIGSAVACISTIGIALLGLGKVFQVPDYILLGAIVSGAFLADKLSPISGLVNLMISTIRISYKKALIYMLRTTLPACIIVSIVYFYMGRNYTIEEYALGNFQKSIGENYFMSPLLLLVPVLIFLLCFLGVKMVNSLFTGVTIGIIISIFCQKVSLVKIFSYILFGYKGNTTSLELNKILVGGGIQSIISIFFIIIMAVALSSIFSGTGIINPIINKMISKVRCREEIIVKTGIISAILTIICDQSMAIILPGELLRDKYKKLKIENYILARTISDTGVVMAPLIPWNGNSLFILALTGISSIKYGPYALLCYVLPIITLCLSFFTKNIPRRELANCKKLRV